LGENPGVDFLAAAPYPAGMASSPRIKPGPIPTLGQIARSASWVWVDCRHCRHRAAARLAPIIERLGADASSDRLRASARCIACAGRGATLMLPSWGDTRSGFVPFPSATAPAKQSLTSI